MTPSAQWSADPTKRNVGTITLVSPTGGSMDLIANKSIRSGQIAAYLEMRDQTLVQAQSQLDQIAASLSSALSDQTVDGTTATSGARSGFDVDVGNLSNGNSVNITYTDTATGTQHQIQVVRVDDPSALPLPASGNPNVQVIGVDFSVGMSSIVDQLNTKFKGKPLFANPSGTKLEVLDDGAANKIDINSVSATSTVTSLTGGTAQMPFFLDGSTALYRSHFRQRIAVHRSRRTHHGQRSARRRSLETRLLSGGHRRGRRDAAEFPLQPAHQRLADLFAGGRHRHGARALQRIAAILRATGAEPAGRCGRRREPIERGPGHGGQFAAAAIQR